MRYRSQLDSTRFVYVQEGILIGVLGAFAKIIWSNFPLIELYGFIGPLIALAFGFKTFGHIKENQNGNNGDDDIPINDKEG